MKKNAVWAVLILAGALRGADTGLAQGTAFTYQGRLSAGNGGANGLYDMTFKLFNASSGGTQVGSTITDSGMVVTNGLFSAALDFGAVFNGTSYWLEVGVRSNGVASFTTLTPRQELTPTPYAITSENLDGLLPATQLSGTLPASALSGTYGNPVTFNSPANSFSGNGSGLSGVNAAALGGLGPNSFWRTTGNAGTTPGANFLGTTDNQPLELKADFVGINRTNPITGADVFSIRSPTTNNYGGMYVDTAGANTLPFYGYAQNGFAQAWTFLNGFDANKWELFNGGDIRLAVTTGGLVGVGTTSPQQGLSVNTSLVVDQINQNAGFLNNYNTNGYGITFGSASGEGIASQRTAGIDLYSLSFYTAFINRMIIMNNGYVGINTINPAARLDVETTDSSAFAPAVQGTTASTNGGVNAVYGLVSSTSPGGSSAAVRGENRGTNYFGIGVYGSQNGSGWGVYGYTPNGYGVYGYSGNGSGVVGQSSAESGVIGASATGSGVYASSGSNALTIASGGIQVSGAGLSTPTAAFVQVCTSANQTAPHRTTIDNPLCNGNPNAILLVTHNYNPGGSGGNLETHPYSVWYNGANSKWEIYNDDFATMAVGTTFNVLIVRP
ncbi:MAG TPA: hypothetical protein VG146_15030 [Verrucomicrobiae bacterium]|nr:hypothetical protein [Verrucomicrobiae bacterium]